MKPLPLIALAVLITLPLALNSCSVFKIDPINQDHLHPEQQDELNRIYQRNNSIARSQLRRNSPRVRRR